MQDECLSPYTPFGPKLVIKKDYFIKSRKDDIRSIYQFNPKPIGRGGYGTVYKAKLKDAPHTERVVKVIPKKFINSHDVLKNQIVVLKKLDHPNITKLYETFEDEKYIYLVLDLCEGGELFDRLEQTGSFSEQEARNIFLQMIKILKYLHINKICHRDLKAENFLFSNKDYQTIKLIDFGLAFEYVADMKKQMEQTGANKIVGTAYYVAPEVLKKDYDQRCDVWSVGVLLYIISTASAPFDGDDDEEIINNIRKNKFADNSQAEQLSPELRDLINKILVPVQSRISLDDIFEHPWIKKSNISSIPLKLSFTEMKKFSNYSKLKAVALSFIASQIPDKEIKQLSELFRQIDSNNDGYLSVTQIEKSLHQNGDKPTYNELHKVLKTIDMDKNGKISYNEFVACMLSEQIIKNKEYLEYVFHTLDTDKSGKISRDELSHMINTMGISTFNGKMVNDMIKSADKDGDGEINFEEFLNCMMEG